MLVTVTTPKDTLGHDRGSATAAVVSATHR